jgi:hypothetical protein
MARVVQKIKSHTSCSITFLENRADYKIMRKNIVEPDRSQMTKTAHAHCILYI